MKNVYQHPDYKPPQKYNNIALIEIDGQIIFTPLGIRPACLQTEQKIEGDDFIGTGWGSRPGEDTSVVFQTINLTRMSFDLCTQEYSLQDGLEKGLVDESQLCAGTFEAKPDSCQVSHITSFYFAF